MFREVRRVLRDDGTFWCEIGDSYAANRSYQVRDNKHTDVGNDMSARVPPGLKPKDLIGQPWMLAFALRADDWYLRSEIIWNKVNAMPESIIDRPTKSHSTIFLLSKSPRYFFDMDAIRQPHQHDGRKVTTVKQGEGSIQHRDGERWPGTGANPRSVWSMATEPYSSAHFATWPTKLVSKMIQAGSSERGCCPECGAPWKRDVQLGELVGTDRGGNYRGREDDADASGANRFESKTEFRPGMSYERTTTGWSPSCSHDGAPVPCTVLDPFAGSGTTLMVARSLGRHSVGIELNESYCKLAAERTQQLSLLT